MVTDLLPESERGHAPDNMHDIPFGTLFTDHMFSMTYSDGRWHDPCIHPYRPISLDPAAMCLHYGQGVFEGMKAYRNGEHVLLFRPADNIRRLNRSAERMVMPRVDEDATRYYLKCLVSIERAWIPPQPGCALYIRPTMVAVEPKLGVRAANKYLFFIVLAPVGPYFKEGFKPVRLMVSTSDARAANGGVGAAKTMGNYAAGLRATKLAEGAGCKQVLWLDACERKFIEEAGTMNVFIKFDDELVTPPLTGTILPGITRDSVLVLARDWGLTVNERRVSIDEVVEGTGSGKVEEMFGTGTAAVITPIGELLYQGKDYRVGNGEVGSLTRRLYDELTGIQYGTHPDPYGWVVEVE